MIITVIITIILNIISKVLFKIILQSALICHKSTKLQLIKLSKLIKGYNDNREKKTALLNSAFLKVGCEIDLKDKNDFACLSSSARTDSFISSHLELSVHYNSQRYDTANHHAVK